MGVKVTGQFEPAGDFSIVDAKDVSGNITSSNIQLSGDASGSLASTASFGHFTGDGSGLTNVFEGTVPSASISTRVTRNEGTGSKILAGQLEFTNITASNNARIDGNLTVAGDYTVSGDTTFVSSSTLIIGDNIIEVNAVNPVRYGGMYVKDVNNNETGSLIWDSTNDYWIAGQSGSEYRIPLQTSTSNLTDNKIVIAQSNGRIESGNITDDGTSVTIPLPITASSHISSSGNIFGTNLIADSASISTRLTTEESNIDDLQTDSGSFSTRVTNLKADSGSFSTRVTTNSSSFATRITNFSAGNVELVSGSATSTGSFGRSEIADNISIGGDILLDEDQRIYFEADKQTWMEANGANLVRIVTNNSQMLLLDHETGNRAVFGNGTKVFIGADNNKLPSNALEVDGTISGSGILSIDGNITGSGNLEIAGNISGSATSTGSFGHLIVQGNITASGTVRADAFESVTGGTAIDFKDTVNVTGNLTASGDLSIDDITASGNISGSATSTGSFGKILGDGSDISNLPVTALNNATENELVTVGSTTTELDAETNLTFDGSNGKLNLSGFNYSNIRVVGSNLGYIMIGDSGATSNFQNYQLVSDAGNLEVRRVNDAVSSVLATPFKIEDDHVEITAFSGNISGSQYSTGSFGRLETAGGVVIDNGNVSATSFTGIFQGALSGSAQIASNISGAFSVSSASFAADILTNSSSFAARDTLSEATSSKILNGELEFTNITGSGHISMSLSSTGSFGEVMVASNLALGGDPISNVGSTGANLTITANNPYINLNDSNSTSGTRVFSIGSDNNKLKFAKMTDDGGTKVEQFLMNGNGNFSMGAGAGNLVEHTNSTGGNLTLDGNNPALNLYDNNATSGQRNKAILSMGGALYIGKTADNGTSAVHHIVVDNSGNIEVPVGNISGSLTSTGSFGRLDIADNVSATSFTGIFNGALSGSAQIATQISGAFAVASASFAADILSNSSSFAARDTLSETTSSKILNGQLEFTNITGSGHISMSLSSTGSFGRVSATTIGGHSPLIVDSNTTFTNSITGSGHISMSLSSTGSFGRISAATIGGHESLLINAPTTASSPVQFDGKVFFETGSIEGDLHIRTNENLMRLGKSTSGIIVSGSEEVSRFATGSDGSIIDLGFTIIDEAGDTVIAGDGDGIHVDSNNYWYNNKYVKFGDGTNNFLSYNATDLKYKGQVIAQTGSFNGEMFINSPTGSMFIGKFTGGLPSSGSGNVSRYATGSDGSIIDLGFTTTDEDGDTVFLSTGDGIVVDSNNYWYTTGHFKLGDSDKYINWDTNNLTLTKVTASGDFVVEGTARVAEYIYHQGDNDTYLRFANNLVNLAAGGKSAIKYDASTSKIIVNNSNANVDFHVMAEDNSELLATDAANNRVGINTKTPGVALEVVGSISGSAQSTGSFGSLVVDGASLDFSNVPTSDPGIAGRVWRDGTDLKISVG